MIIYSNNILHKRYVCRSIVIYFFSILTLNLKVCDENAVLELFIINVKVTVNVLHCVNCDNEYDGHYACR